MFQRELRIMLQPPPPPVTLPPITQSTTAPSTVESFRVQTTGISPSDYATLLPGFPVEATFSVDETGEYLVIQVTGSGTQRVIVLFYSVNGATEAYEGTV